jgi:hypothetical protein
MDIRIHTYCRVTSGNIRLNGEPVFASSAPAQRFLTEVRQRTEADGRKFAKMDLLSKLGCVAAELLMDGFDRNLPKEDMGIILFNRSSSLDTDEHFQQTIPHGEACFPSPALFVYTLPNIVTGEIAIRYRIHGETAFYILPSPDSHRIEAVIRDTMTTSGLRYVLAGWLEACGETLDALLMLCESGGDNEALPLLNAANITKGLCGQRM